MDAQPSLEGLLTSLRADVTSGAAQLARKAAEAMRTAALRLPAASYEELESGLADVARSVVDAQPAMAPMVALARTVLGAVEAVGDLDVARRAAAEAARAFATDLSTRMERAVTRAAALLPAGGSILTVSSSSTVRETLLRGPGRGTLRVVCLEGRPLMEGRALAAELAGAGMTVTVAVDAAAASLAPECTQVLVGADSIGDLGVVNKIGTRAAAEAGQRAGVQVHVIADETKMLPRAFPQALDDDRPAEEVWQAPAGVRVWNRYFEAVPLELVSSIVTDVGVFTPAETEARRRRMRLPRALRSWVEEA